MADTILATHFALMVFLEVVGMFPSGWRSLEGQEVNLQQIKL